MRLRERSMTRRGFLSGSMMTCSGWTPSGQSVPCGSRMTAPKSIYSRRRERTTSALSRTEGVLSYSSASGVASMSRGDAGCDPVGDLLQIWLIGAWHTRHVVEGGPPQAAGTVGCGRPRAGA